MAQSVHPPLIRLGAAARMLRPVHGHLITCAALSAIGAAAGLAPYVAVAEIARVMLTAPNAGAVWSWVGIGVGGGLLRLVAESLSSHVGHHADATMLHDLRVRLVRRLGVVPLGWFRSSGAGQVTKAMTDDLEAMHNLFAHSLGQIVGASAGILVGFGYLVTVDWRMALVTMAVPAIAVGCYQVAMRSMPDHTARLIEAEARISTSAVEYVDGITIAKANGGTEGRLLERFGEALSERAEAFRVWIAECRYSTALNRAFGSEMTVLAVVLAVGLALVAGGSLPAAAMLPFLAVGVGLPASLHPLIEGTIALRLARLAAGHIEQLLEQPPLPEPARPREPAGHDVELERVAFSYDGSTPALLDINAVCEPGTVTAVVGPSGAGKSTLASLLPRFYDVTDGAIRIGGVDVRDMAPETLLSSMSLVFQDVVLLRDTVTENIRVARPDADDEAVLAAAKAAQVHDVVERLPNGYDTMLGGEGVGLSGGERQRITIARAILSGAPIVVLDEATAALDPDNESAVQDAMSELVAGKTVLVIAHRLHTVAGAAQILVLDEGRLVERGTHDQLLARDGLYTRMWRAQQSGDAE